MKSLGKAVALAALLVGATANAQPMGRTVIPFGPGASSWSSAVHGDVNAMQGMWLDAIGRVFFRAATGLDYGAGLMLQPVGAYGDNSHDDTTALQTLLTACTAHIAFIPAGNYKISSALTINPQCKIIGAGRGATTITQTSGSAYAFQYLSALTGNRDIDMGGSIEDMTIVAKNGIQLNQSGNYASVFSQQANLKGFVIRRVTLTGTYSNGVDANYDTATAATETALEAFGVGVNMAKAFDSRIEDSLIQSYGVAVRFDGSDLNIVDNSRLSNNARVWYSYFHDTYGSQNKMHHCDILQGHRVGWIYLDGARFHTIQDNYMEAYTAAATYIQTSNDIGTNIVDNRFDDTQQSSTAWLVAAPSYGMNVYGNRWNPSSPTPPTTFQNTNYNTSFPTLATWSHNEFMGSGQPFPAPDYPGVIVGSFDPYTFRYNNYNNLGGAGSASWPWIVSGVTGRYVVQTTTADVVYKFYQQDRSHRRFEVAVTGRKITAGGFMNITYVENSTSYTLRSASAGLTSTTGDQTVKFTITLPDAVQGAGAGGYIQVDIVNTEAEIESIILTPVDYEVATSAPTANTYALGDRVFNSSPTAGVLNEGWICTTAGTASNTAWQASTAYSLGTRVYNGSNVYEVTTAGTSAGSGGPTGTGSSIADGTVTWKYVNPLAVFKQFGIINGATPASITTGTGAGTGATATVTGTDTDGSISVTTGTSPTAGGSICTVTFGVAAPTGSTVIIFPTNGFAAGKNTAVQVFSSTNSFSLTNANSALAAGTPYTWNYIVVRH